MINGVGSFLMTVHNLCNYMLGSKYNGRDYVVLAVGRDGSPLEYVSEELKRDRELVLAAVQQNTEALRDASKKL